MDRIAANHLSGLSETMRMVSPHEWRWSDVSSEVPLIAVDYLTELKKMLMREFVKVSALREENDRKGSSTENSAKLERDVFLFLHRSNVVSQEVLPMLEAAMAPSLAGGGENEMYRKKSVGHACVRFLCAVTTVSEKEGSREDLSAMLDGCVPALARVPAMGAVVRSAGDLLVRRLETPLDQEELEHVEVSLMLLRNIARAIKPDTRDAYLQVLHDAGGSDFILLAMKQNNAMFVPDAEMRNRWNIVLGSLLVALLELAPHMSDMVPEPLAGATYRQPAPGTAPVHTPKPTVPRSPLLCSESLVRKSLTGENVVCRSDTAWSMRLKDLDSNKPRRMIRKNKNLSTAATEKTQMNTSELPHRARFVLATLMHGFTTLCFREWLDVAFRHVKDWQVTSDDGVERFEEKAFETSDFANACPTYIREFFTLVGLTLAYVKEIAKAQPSGVPALREAALDPVYNQHGPDLLDSAIRVLNAVHFRVRTHDMASMVFFMKDYVTGLVMFHPQQHPLKNRLVEECDLFGKLLSYIRKFKPGIGVGTLYVPGLVQLTHVVTALHRQIDPLEGELTCVLSVSARAENLYPFLVALEMWEFNTPETNRSLISLFYSMVHVRCHGPLLNVAFLFAYSDILTRSVGLPAHAEMRNFALRMVRATLDTASPSQFCVPRMLFWLSGTSWKDVSLEFSREALAKDNNKKRGRGGSDEDEDDVANEVFASSSEDGVGGGDERQEVDHADIEALLDRHRERWRGMLAEGGLQEPMALDG